MDSKIAASEMQILQEEVSCLNDLGIEYMMNGKLRNASEHFHHALARLRVITKMKKQFCSRPNRAGLLGHESFDPVASLRAPHIKKSCEPLPIDKASSVLTLHWETIASVSLMYNASLVHFRCEKFTRAKTLLDLARGLLKKKLNEDSISHVLEGNKYAASVVISIYIAYGRVILKLPYGDKTQASQSFKMASVLLSRLKSSCRKSTSFLQGQEIPRSLKMLPSLKAVYNPMTEQDDIPSLVNAETDNSISVGENNKFHEDQNNQSNESQELVDENNKFDTNIEQNYFFKSDDVLSSNHIQPGDYWNSAESYTCL